MFNLFKKTAFGLDISDFSIEALELASKEKIKAFGRVILEEGIVKDGFILNKEKLAEKIREVVSRAKIRASRVVLALPESKVFMHVFKLPENLKGKELRDVIAGEAAKTIPLDPERVHWDYMQSLRDRADKWGLGRGFRRLLHVGTLYVGTLKEIIDSYIEVLDKVGLESIVFDIESAALGRALLKSKTLNPKSDVSIMLVDIGARTTNVSIFKDSILQASSTISVAGNQFTKAIAEKLKISQERAEKLKRSSGLLEGRQEGRVMLILQRELQPILKKIREIINFYGKDISQVLLVGGSSQMPNIANYFSANLGLKVSIGISPIARGLGKNPILYNTVAGLALRALEKNPKKTGLNLLPEE